MNKAVLGLLCVLLAAPFAIAQAKSDAGLPPLINRDLIFGDPDIAGAQISPDGHYLAFLKPWHETRNIYVKAVDEPFSAARLMTTEAKRPVAGYLWTRDSRYIVYVKDNAGDENYNVYAVDPAAQPAAGADAPPSRDLTGLKGVRVELYAAPRSEPDALYIGINDRDKAWHDLYKVKISTGEKTLLRKNTDRITGWYFDNNDELRLATRNAENGDTEILRVDAGKLTPIYSCNVFETCAPLHFQPGNSKVYIESNKGTDLISLMLLDPATGTTSLVESDPLNKVDFGGALFNQSNDQLIETWYTDARTKTYFRDKSYGNDYRWLEKKYDGKEIAVVSSTKDEQVWLVRASADVEPGEFFLFERRGHRITPQFTIWEDIPRASLAEMTFVTYHSSDGLEIPAYLTLPKGLPPTNLPALVIPHGGPWGRDEWGYNPLAQFFANRGYAVLMPNFRGSTGYGRKYLDAGNLEWGKKMQDDLTWGVKYLVEQGIADPKRVGIFGGSYGGYATLAGIAFTPETYAAAVDICGPSNLISLVDSIPPYWEAIRQMFDVRMGDPGTPDGKKLLEAASPLNSVGHIKTPLLVAQGANDPRVNRREAEQIVIALRDRGFPVEYILAPDEGHGFARPVNMLALMAASEQFLAVHLGGRTQQGGSPEEMLRLKDITVDPSTVVLAPKIDASTVGVPKPAFDLTPGTHHFDVTVSAGGQQMKLKVTAIIADAGPTWTAEEDMDTPGGAVTDKAVVEKTSLLVMKHNMQQGPATIDLDFAGNKAVGKVSMNGQDTNVNVDLGGPIFGDAAGGNEEIACLPLAEGYATTFRNFDVQTQKVRLLQLNVAGSDSVTVPAGTFDAWRVEITSADGGADKKTVWVTKDTHKVVRISAVLASMGGATVTEEATD
jgi:dipeptidyl aminopeptidase/acylaminoacyl peptidase